MVENPRTQLKAELLEASKKPNDLMEMAKVVAKYNSPSESPFQVQSRIVFVHDQIKDFVKQKKKEGVTVKDNEILLVSHGWFLTQMLGLREILAHDTYGKSAEEWGNCEYRGFNVEL